MLWRSWHTSSKSQNKVSRPVWHGGLMSIGRCPLSTVEYQSNPKHNFPMPLLRIRPTPNLSSRAKYEFDPVGSNNVMHTISCTAQSVIVEVRLTHKLYTSKICPLAARAQEWSVSHHTSSIFNLALINNVKMSLLQIHKQYNLYEQSQKKI